MRVCTYPCTPTLKPFDRRVDHLPGGVPTLFRMRYQMDCGQSSKIYSTVNS